MIAEIRRLNPKPGLAFGSALVQPIVPDVFVRPGPDGGWIVELNSDTLPKVLVNQSYYAEVSATTRRDTDKSYLAECLQSATWLVRALDQRARTILKVSNEIVRQQDGFFAHGVEHLRPLNLKTVAEAISSTELNEAHATTTEPSGSFSAGIPNRITAGMPSALAAPASATASVTESRSMPGIVQIGSRPSSSSATNNG